MKKMMVAVAAVVAVAVAHAGTVSWSCSNVKQDGTALTTGASYVFFCETAAAAAAGVKAFQDASGTGTTALNTLLADATWHDTKKTTLAGNFGIGTTSAMGKYTLPTPTSLGLADGTKYYMYMVVTDTTTVGDTTKYLIAQGDATTIGATTAGAASGSNVAFALGSQASNTTWYTAVAAPEPTSALLLLIGIAGLALKRKIA